MDQLNSLPYLEIFVRETLRIFAPVQTVPRVAAKDDILPLDCPVTDKKGITHRSLRFLVFFCYYLPTSLMHWSTFLESSKVRAS